MSKPATSQTRGRLRGAITLIVMAMLAAALLSSIARFTAPRIAGNLAAERLKGLRAVLLPGSYDNKPHLDRIEVLDPELLGSDKPLPIFRARLGTQPVAAVMTVVAPNGFSGRIRVLVGVNIDDEVTGVRVIEHRETPGLGDKVEIGKSDWVLGFRGLHSEEPLTDAWTLTRDGGDFDQITGATVTSRAVLKAVRNAVLYFDVHRDDIWSAPAVQN